MRINKSIMEAKTMNDRYFSDFHLAGFTYYNGVDIFDKLKIGVTLNAVNEPENKFDPYAVALYFEDVKLGFIPRGCNTEISKFFRLGYNDMFEFTISRVIPEAHPEKQLHVLVRIVPRK
jgi:hypothetical protein